MNEMINVINDYLKLKEDYKEYNNENLYEVFDIFANEVVELCDIVTNIDYKINLLIEEGNLPVYTTINKIDEAEENLLNEIADVILTTARLIKEFKLEEPLIEMMDYKYHRQCLREDKRKNGSK